MKSRNQLYIFLAVWLAIFLVCSVLSGVAYSGDDPTSADPNHTESTVDQTKGNDSPADPANTDSKPEQPIEPTVPPTPYDELTYSAENAQYLIFVDAGHGWVDGGSSARLTADGEYVYEEKDENGQTIYVTESGTVVSETDFTHILEKDITLVLSQKLKRALEAMGYTVGETRTGDTEADCPVNLINGIFNAQRRPAYVNEQGADYFVSLHCNTYPDSAVSGTRIYYSQYRDSSLELATALKVALLSEMEIDATLHTDNLAITRESAMPAVLIESGFVTNHDDLAKLLDSDWQDQFVCALAKGIDANLHAQSAN